jgi:hypothetical protein
MGALHHGRMDVLVIDTNVRFQVPRTVSDVSSIEAMVNASAGDGRTWSRITNKTSVKPCTAGTLDVRWMSTEVKHVQTGVSDKLRRIENQLIDAFNNERPRSAAQNRGFRQTRHVRMIPI